MTTRRPAIGTSPLDALLSDAGPSSSPSPARRRTAPVGSRQPSTRTAAPGAAATSATRTKATYLLPTAVVERARSAAVALAGPPARLTLAAIVTEAITREIDRLERTYNAAKPFDRNAAPLKGGRPIVDRQGPPRQKRQ